MKQQIIVRKREPMLSELFQVYGFKKYKTPYASAQMCDLYAHNLLSTDDCCGCSCEVVVDFDCCETLIDWYKPKTLSGQST